MKHWITYLLAQFIIGISFGQMSIIKHYTTEDGLPHDITYEMIQDKNHHIWIGTDDGLTRFDGKTFTNYNNEGLLSNYVIALKEQEDRIFLGTWGGGLHILANNKIQPYNTLKKNNQKIEKFELLSDNSIIVQQAISDYGIFNLTQDSITGFEIGLVNGKPKLLEPTDYNLKTYDIKTFTFTKLGEDVYIHSNLTPKLNYTPLKGLYTLHQNTLQSVIPETLSSTYISAIYLSLDTLWTINKNNTIFKIYDNTVLDSIPLPDFNEQVIKLKKHDKYLYLLSNQFILYMYNLETKTIKDLSAEFNIDRYISDFIFDNENNLWISTYGQGVYQIQQSKNTFLNQKPLTNSVIKDFTFINDTLLTLSPGLLSMLYEDSIIGHIKTSVNTKLNFLLEPNDTVEIIDFFNKTHKTYNWPIIFTKPNSVNSKTYKHFRCEINKNALTFYNTTTNTRIKYIPHPINITDLKIVDDKIYVTYFNLGLTIYDFKGEILKTYHTDQGFPTNKINAFIVRDDHLLLATPIGLFNIYENRTTRYTTANGLLSNHINSIYLDHHGVLWIGTQRGLNLLKEDVVYVINKCTGQNSSFITKIKEHQNKIYATGNKGIFIYNNIQPFNPHSHTKLIVNQEHTTFRISKINFTNHNSIETEYRINQLPWVKFNENTLHFNHLAQDEYTIQFKYKDYSSDWTLSPVYTFAIKLPWHTQVWFYISLLSFISILIISIIYKQLKQVKQKNIIFQNTILEKENLRQELNNVRSNIAQDFHDDLGNKLASISLLSKIELEKRKPIESDLENIKQIQKDADILYSGMRDFIWALDHKNNNLQELQAYLNDFGEQLFEHSDMVFLSTNNISDSKIKLPYYWNKQLILVFKEGMTNALKHSKAQLICFDVNLNGNVLEIILKDDGIGYDPHNLKRVNGLKNMKSRIESINQTLIIIPENGVSIYFKGEI